MLIDVEARWDDSAVGRTFKDPAQFGSFIEAMVRTALAGKTLVTITVMVEDEQPPIEINISGDLL